LANIVSAHEISPRRQGGHRAERRGDGEALAEILTTDGHGSTGPFWFIFFTTPTRCAEVGRGWKKKLWKDIEHLSVTYGTGMADETNAEKKRKVHHGGTESTEKKLKSGKTKNLKWLNRLIHADEKN
jgi:hypothetical protein